MIRKHLNSEKLDDYVCNSCYFLLSKFIWKMINNLYKFEKFLIQTHDFNDFNSNFTIKFKITK